VALLPLLKPYSPTHITKHHLLEMPRRLKYKADATSDFQNSNVDVSAVVKEVIDTIRANGDIAVRKYSEKFDKWSPQSFKLSRAQIDSAIAACPEQTIKDIKEVQANVRKFAEAQRKSILDFELEIQPGVHLGQKNLPINTVEA
jgi:histidinol dehydrogenase